MKNMKILATKYMTTIKKILFASIVLCTAFVSSVYGGSYIITTTAGTGTAGYSGDGDQATSAKINQPFCMAFDASGNLYFADGSNYRIRKINTSGVISTVAGTGVAGFSGDGGLATSAKLNYPHGIAIDILGNIYFTDLINRCVRKINTSGIISTIAGTGTQGYSGDGGLATLAQLDSPFDVAVDTSGNIYISDHANHRVRRVNTAGVISTVAGTGVAGFSGDGGLATSAKLNYPWGVAIDALGNIYITDASNNRIRKINTSGVISTVAGTGVAGFSGDGGLATSAKLNSPFAITLDTFGNIFIAGSGQSNDSRARKIDTSGIITTFAGTGIDGFLGDGSNATLAQLNQPYGITVDITGNIYIADTLNNRIRKVIIPQMGYISGKVTKSDGTTAIAGVAVQVQQSGVVKSITTTNITGNYSITIVTGTYDVSVSSTGYQPQTKTGYNVTNGSTVTVNFSLIQIPQKGIISGKVTKTDGTTALSGVLVEAMQSGVTKLSATSDASGNYSIIIGTGTYNVKASVTGYLSQTKTGYNATNGSTNTVNFSLVGLSVAKFGVISGKATQSDGTTAISGALIEALQLGVIKSSILTDANGNYSITIGTGTYDINASLSGYQSQTKTGYSVANGSTVTVNFSLTAVSSAQTGILSCTITTSTGSAITNAVISIYQGSTLVNQVLSDSSGKYSISLGAGSYDITVSKTGYQTATQKGVSITAGQTASASFSLAQSIVTQTGTLACNVQCNGVAVQNAVIRVNQNNNLIDMEQSDYLGNYSFSLAVGAYNLNVSKAGYQTSTQTGVIVSNNQTTNVYISLLQTTQAKPQADKQTTLGDNLFRPSSGGTCKIGFNVPQSGGVTIKICDFKGRQVRNAFDNTNYTAGSYQWNWDGKDDAGKVVSPGVYILYFKYPGGTETRKIGVK
jgi:hypothetical protein